MNKPELLAPAGDLEKLKIAVLYGADAVFVGTKNFSLRSRASNFTIGDLKEGAKFCHEHNAKLYVTVNIVAHNDDLLGFIDYLQELEEAKVDGLICSSFAIIDLIKKHTNLDIHISTQQSVSNSNAVNFYDKFGAKRVVLARELSVEEIKEVKKKTNIELEVFIHGGMCSSYSGRCMLSNHMTNRDANRGGCAHSCRWNYNLYKGEEKISDEDYFQFASKDLMAVRVLPDLIPYVDSLKIEGRMKSLHYIATVVKTYRQEIDEFVNNGFIKDFTYYEKEIKKAENREFASGFLASGFRNDIQLYGARSDRANQDFIGMILDYDKENKRAKMEVRNYFERGETIEIFAPKGENKTLVIEKLFDEDLNSIDVARHPKDIIYFSSDIEMEKDTIIRVMR